MRCRRQSNGTMEEAREALADPQAEVHLQVSAAQVPSSPVLPVVHWLARCGWYTHDYPATAREETGLNPIACRWLTSRLVRQTTASCTSTPS
jgi:hypothetical protein